MPVESLGRDRYRVRVYVGVDPETKRPRQLSKTFRAKSADERKKLAAKWEAKLRDEVEAERKKVGTVEQAVREWERHKRATTSPTTRQRNKTITDKIVADLGRTQLHRLTVRDVDRWYDQLRTETVKGHGDNRRVRSEATIHHYHRVLSSILRQAVRWDQIPSAPTDRATVPKKGRARPTIPATSTVLELVASASPQLRFAAALAARTGLRRGELLGLLWSDVDGNELVVSRALIETRAGLDVKPPKTGEPRRIAIGPETVDAIASYRAWLETQTDELAADSCMFPNLPADTLGRIPRRPHWLTQAWTKHCDAHGVHVRFHDLRHWHISTLIDMGIPIASVSERAGHAQTSTTLNIYTHAVRETDVKAAAAIEAALSGGSSAPALPAEFRQRRNSGITDGSRVS